MTTLGIGSGSGNWNVELSTEGVSLPGWLAGSAMVGQVVGSKLESWTCDQLVIDALFGFAP